jgi:hypothetical protein
MPDDSILKEETHSVDQMIAYQVTLIDSLKHDLSKPTKTIETELGLLRELTTAIIILRELREMSFNRQRFTQS